jgi:hypothetical protein
MQKKKSTTDSSFTSRKQNLVVQIVMRRIIFERGVPFSINAPELMRGLVQQLCSYLNISQIRTEATIPEAMRYVNALIKL